MPVVGGVSNHSASSWTITSGGTTWINTTDSSQVGTDWATFPWEFPQLFMSNNERIDLFNDYLFWKCKSVHVTFKNFRSYVNTVSTTSTIPNTFPTDNAAFMTYLDEMYYLGIQVAPFITESGWLDATSSQNIVKSWQCGGYTEDTRISLPVFDIKVDNQYENIISQNYPNVTQTQAIAGEVVTHSWHTVGDKYWRDTSEFIWGMNAQSDDVVPATQTGKAFPGYVRPFRADEFGGYILSGNSTTATAPSTYFFNSVFNTSQRLATNSKNTAANVPPVVYTTHEPIPPLLLRICPQHIEGNGNSTHIQFDFEVHFNIEVRCKVPKHGYTNLADWTKPASIDFATTLGLNRIGGQTVIMPQYQGAGIASNLATWSIPANTGSLQRGRIKNGYVFIPYSGWESALSIVTAPPAPPEENTMPLAMFLDVSYNNGYRYIYDTASDKQARDLHHIDITGYPKDAVVLVTGKAYTGSGSTSDPIKLEPPAPPLGFVITNWDQVYHPTGPAAYQFALETGTVYCILRGASSGSSEHAVTGYWLALPQAPTPAVPLLHNVNYLSAESALPVQSAPAPANAGKESGLANCSEEDIKPKRGKKRRDINGGASKYRKEFTCEITDSESEFL